MWPYLICVQAQIYFLQPPHAPQIAPRYVMTQLLRSGLISHKLGKHLDDLNSLLPRASPMQPAFNWPASNHMLHPQRICYRSLKRCYNVIVYKPNRIHKFPCTFFTKNAYELPTPGLGRLCTFLYARHATM